MTCTCQQGTTTGSSFVATVNLPPTVAAAATEPLDDPFPVPAYPPASWFTDRPDWLTPETKIAVADDGRVAGYFYHAGQCLVHDPSACPKPSPTGYAAFHQQAVATEDGTLIRVGVIGNTNGHADPRAKIDVAQAHYADPDRQLISCRAYDDEHGGYILGAMIPTATYENVRLVRASALSGDWRQMAGSWWDAHGIQAAVVNDCEGYDCIGPTLVTRPGLPLVRQFSRAAVLGGVGGVQLDDERELRMTQTRIDVPGGVTITTEAPMPAPGPHPVEEPPATMQAASPPPAAGGGEPAADTQAEGDVAARVAQLEQDVADIKDVIGQLIDAMNAPMAAAAELPPEE